MKQISKILVALAVTFISLNASAQICPNGQTWNAEAQACRPAVSSSSTPNASFAPPANPQAWCEAGGYCDGNATPPPATPQRVARPPRPQWFVVVNGNLEDSRQHGEIENTDYGRIEYGIGGSIRCPEGTIGLALSTSSLAYLRDEAGHRFVSGTFCAPLGTTQSPELRMDLYVTLEMFNLLVARVADLERRMGEHDTMILTINEDLDSVTETVYRDLCRDKMDEVSFQQWVDATPAERIALCPQVVRESGDSEPSLHYRLRLGGQFMIGSSVDSTLLTAGLVTFGVELFSTNNRHGLIVRGEVGSSNMRGTQGAAPIRRTTLFGGSLAYGFRPLNWATVSLGGRVLGMSDHNGDPDLYHGYRGTLAGPELALTLDRQIQNGPFGVYLRVSASFLRGRTNYWINSEEVSTGRSSVNLGLEGGFTFGR